MADGFTKCLVFCRTTLMYMANCLNISLFTLPASYELVYVTFVRTPENFFVQRCSDKDRLQHLMYNLNHYCNTSDQPDDLVFCPEKGIIKHFSF